LRLIAQSQRPRVRQPALLKPIANSQCLSILASRPLLSSSSHSFEAANASATVPSQARSLRASPRARTLATRKDPVFVRSFRSLIHNDKQQMSDNRCQMPEGISVSHRHQL